MGYISRHTTMMRRREREAARDDKDDDDGCALACACACDFVSLKSFPLSFVVKFCSRRLPPSLEGWRKRAFVRSKA